MDKNPLYENYSWTDLLEDESFRAWQGDPNGPLAADWAQRQQDHPHLRAEIDRARSFLAAVAAERAATDVDPQRQRTAYDQLLTVHRQRAANPRARPKVRRRRLHWGTAAAVLLLLGLAGWLLLAPLTGPEPIVHTTPFGEQQRVELPDGTVVQLNAGSELRYFANWDAAEQRAVWLTGEAFFSVTKQPARYPQKFVVHTADLDVNVLGTRFNVNTQARLGTEVVLDEGAIELAVDRGSGAPDTLAVTPGERIVFDRDRRQLTRDRVPEQSAVTSWKEGRLVFEDVTLAEAGFRLRQIFGRELRFGDPELAQRKIYLTTSATDLSEFKQILEAMTDNELRVTLQPQYLLIEYR